ncbi:MAG: glutamate racemase [Anaerolineae bacterium]|nr:glutamate racemase [Anaerolineae bacterium]
MGGFNAKIGVLDSGIGGLSVLREIQRLLPAHPTVFVADQQHLPYGPRSTPEIQQFSEGITRFLIEQGAAVVVMACNTASAASLFYLREVFPTLPIVGMEPALKPALAESQSGVVGVLSTQATAEGVLYRRLLERYAEGKQVITQVAPELVRIAEAQSQHTPESRAIIRGYVEPIVAAGADAIVLACTHFPFVADAIQDVVGAGVRLIDPSVAVARQTARVWPVDVEPGRDTPAYYTTGDTSLFQTRLKALTGIGATAAGLTWSADERVLGLRG